jgi:hypothetical protein
LKPSKNSTMTDGMGGIFYELKSQSQTNQIFREFAGRISVRLAFNGDDDGQLSDK